MSTIRVANAPVSWGVLEFEGLPAKTYSWSEVLDEIAATGYTGTELGDYGFLPTDPDRLRAELDRRGLAMLGAFVQTRFRDPEAHAAGEARALEVARLLAATARGSDTVPIIVLADDNAVDPARTLNAGRATPDLALSPAEMRTFAQGVDRVARRVRDETGLPSVFHHHSAGFVETPAEIDALLAASDPDLVGLVFDTGHYAYGAGPGYDGDIAAALDRYGDRIRHVHFKDFDPAVARQARAEGWDYLTTIQRGIFSELGTGGVDFPAVVDWLRRHGYDGWIVVEQDVLPGMGSPRESAERNRAYLRSIGL